MAENESSPASPLQFDTAEYATPQPAASVCGVCKQPIADAYYTVNDAVVCDQCRDQVEAFTTGGSRLWRVFAATALGLIAGLAGAALWYAVRRGTGYEVGLIAILVGLMVGLAVRKGSKGRGGWFYQTLAILLTYGCICAQYMPDIIEVIVKKSREQVAVEAAAKDMAAKADRKTADEKGPAGKAPAAPALAEKKPAEKAPAEKAAPPDPAMPRPGIGQIAAALAAFLAIVFAVALAAPFLAGAKNLIGLLIIGFALYEAWKLNKRVPLQIAGPFRLAPIPVPAPGVSTMDVDPNSAAPGAPGA